jgi:hypothetical protein
MLPPEKCDVIEMPNHNYLCHRVMPELNVPTYTQLKLSKGIMSCLCRAQ